MSFKDITKSKRRALKSLGASIPDDLCSGDDSDVETYFKDEYKNNKYQNFGGNSLNSDTESKLYSHEEDPVLQLRRRTLRNTLTRQSKQYMNSIKTTLKSGPKNFDRRRSRAVLMDLAGGGRFGKGKSINLLSNAKHSKVKNAWTRSKRAWTESNAPQYSRMTIFDKNYSLILQIFQNKFVQTNSPKPTHFSYLIPLFIKWPQKKQNKILSAYITGT